MDKGYQDPVEKFFTDIFGFISLIVMGVVFLPFVGIGIAIGYWIWG